MKYALRSNTLKAAAAVLAMMNLSLPAFATDLLYQPTLSQHDDTSASVTADGKGVKLFSFCPKPLKMGGVAMLMISPLDVQPRSAANPMPYPELTKVVFDERDTAVDIIHANNTSDVVLEIVYGTSDVSKPLKIEYRRIEWNAMGHNGAQCIADINKVLQPFRNSGYLCGVSRMAIGGGELLMPICNKALNCTISNVWVDDRSGHPMHFELEPRAREGGRDIMAFDGKY